MLENNKCIFCKIIVDIKSGSLQDKSSIINVTKDLIVIKDINPQAPIHYLIIPQKHIENIFLAQDEDSWLGSAIFLEAKRLSEKLALEFKDNNFKLIINNGYNAGQRVFHLHAHFVSDFAPNINVYI